MKLRPHWIPGSNTDIPPAAARKLLAQGYGITMHGDIIPPHIMQEHQKQKERQERKHQKQQQHWQKIREGKTAMQPLLDGEAELPDCTIPITWTSLIPPDWHEPDDAPQILGSGELDGITLNIDLYPNANLTRWHHHVETHDNKTGNHIEDEIPHTRAHGYSTTAITAAEKALLDATSFIVELRRQRNA